MRKTVFKLYFYNAVMKVNDSGKVVDKVTLIWEIKLFLLLYTITRGNVLVPLVRLETSGWVMQGALLFKKKKCLVMFSAFLLISQYFLG